MHIELFYSYINSFQTYSHFCQPSQAVKVYSSLIQLPIEPKNLPRARLFSKSINLKQDLNESSPSYAWIAGFMYGATQDVHNEIPKDTNTNFV